MWLPTEEQQAKFGTAHTQNVLGYKDTYSIDIVVIGVENANPSKINIGSGGCLDEILQTFKAGQA